MNELGHAHTKGNRRVESLVGGFSHPGLRISCGVRDLSPEEYLRVLSPPSPDRRLRQQERNSLSFTSLERRHPSKVSHDCSCHNALVSLAMVRTRQGVLEMRGVFQFAFS